MKHFTCFLILIVSSLSANCQYADDLFFSEYIEGSSNNKYLEIFNGTGSSIDLSNYILMLFQNGDSIPSRTNLLEGLLQHEEVIVYKYSLATIYNDTAIVATACYYNGDDAVGLFKISDSCFVDIIGSIGEDPGSEWSIDDFSTLDKTLIRKPTVTTGISKNPNAGFPTLATEWDVFDQNYIGNLGQHTFSPITNRSLNLIAPSAGESYIIGQTYTFKWEAENVNFISFQLYMSDHEGWHTIPGLDSIDASLQTLDFQIPSESIAGSYNLRIVDISYDSIMDESGLYNVVAASNSVELATDAFWPSSGSEFVYTDLRTSTMSISFIDSVAIGDGSIYLKLFSDSSVIETFSLNNENLFISNNNPNMVIMQLLLDELPSNTIFFVDIDSNAIRDYSIDTLYFCGIKNSDTWHFATGEEKFEKTIQEIQTPIDETGDSPYSGSEVRTKGVITFIDDTGFYIQNEGDEYAGLYVNYDPTEIPGIWTDITVIGTVNETNNMTQLNSVSVLDYFSIDCDCTIEPKEIELPIKEAHESMLLSVINIDKVDIEKLPDWNLYSADTSGIMGGKYFILDIPTCECPLPNIKKVTGLITDEKEVLKIMPREMNDISIINNIKSTKTELRIITLSNGEILLKSNNKTIENVNIYSLSGVYTTQSQRKGKEILIPAIRRNAGIYLVKVQLQNDEIITKKIVVK
ncbi:MAG: T9SS type A sorting domain-containing protein [Marinilabiliaceae bacterium]|nr:T9SS type A sorting domain-containing protein [Marinilabiliaceae bacterium]